MKHLRLLCALSISSVWFASSPITFAQQAEKNQGEEVTGADFVEDEMDLILRIRTQVEFIEVPTTVMLDLLYGEKPLRDSELRAKLQVMLKQGKASLIDSQMVSLLSNEKVTVESIEELIYPTEYEPAEMPNHISISPKKGQTNGQTITTPQLSTPPTPTAFETRNVGSTLIIEAHLDPDDLDKVIMSLSPEIVYHVGWEAFLDWKGKKSEMQIKMPIFYTLRLNTALTLEQGKYSLVAAMSPKNAKGLPDLSKKIIVFVKADVIRKK